MAARAGAGNSGLLQGCAAGRGFQEGGSRRRGQEEKETLGSEL